MDREQIKEQYSMRDILSMYGIRANRAGFISCPFHTGDRTPSMKIYPNDYHCHACGANGDIFSFVQGMEHCSFKDAFQKLGGTYEEKSDYQRDLFQHRMKLKNEKEQREQIARKRRRNELAFDIRIQRIFTHCEVFSDEWCAAVNQLEMDLLKMENIRLRGSENDY